jgi:hypothetical protein
MDSASCGALVENILGDGRDEVAGAKDLNFRLILGLRTER